MSHAVPIRSQNVSRETLAKLKAYEALLIKWNATINLVGKSSIFDLWQRHIEDSLQLLPLLPTKVERLADLGTGAGLPGLVIAISRPDIPVFLIEKDQRKSAFIREVISQLGLTNTTVLTMDICDVTMVFSVITARALASLSLLCALAHPLSRPTTVFLFPKGKNATSELAEATASWNFRHHFIPSRTQELSSIISLTELYPKGSIVL